MQTNVYVHCKNGHGRAPTLVAAYLTRKGKPPAEAEAFIKSKRPSIHLEEAQRAALRYFSAKGVSASPASPSEAERVGRSPEK